MQTFVRVVERGGFSAAAREAGTTQGAVSKQVAALERLLGARLLSRTTRSLALTGEGESYFEQARRLLAEVAEVEGALRRGERQLTGWLRVTAPAAYGRLKLLPLVGRFLAEHPAVKVDLRLHDGHVDLVEQGIDIAVRIGDPGAGPLLLTRRAGTVQRALVASRKYLRSRPRGPKTPRTPDDLLQHNCIVCTELSAPDAWTFSAGPRAKAAAGTTVTVRAQGSLQTNSPEVLRAAVLAGLGIGHAPTWLFDDELAAGELQVLLPDWPAPPLPIHLVSPLQGRPSSKVQAFADHVIAACAAGPGGA